MGQALYRKYRSRTLDEVVGQSHITAMLKSAIASGNTSHAYLLTGPRGVGKTSIARILAHEINGLAYSDESTHLDIIEIDAASNNSVEDIRDLRDKVMIAPTSASKKIYIIDEVHMLSKSAFNALLKTLEEPPEHVIFILATTDVEKLPATIISRVQRFNFRLINPADAIPHLRKISDAEGINISDEALALVAHHGQGSFRDSISLLDQLRSVSSETITPALVEKVVGLASDEVVTELLAAYEAQNISRIAELLSDVESRGIAAATLASQLIQAIRDGIVTHPERLSLLDKLLEVSKSAWPHVKLLTALAANVAAIAAPSAAQTAPTPIATPAPTRSAPTPPPTSTHVAKPTEQPAKKEEVITTALPIDEGKPAVAVIPLGEDQPFPWADLLAAIKEKATGAYSLLGKCGYTFVDNILTIYAGKAFTKTQINKAMPHLMVALELVGVSDGTINVLASVKPPKDSTIAAALDIMGGGEEVIL